MKNWEKNGKGVVIAPEFKTAATVNKLIRMIEDKGWTDRLHTIAQKAWLDIEEKLKLDRKRRYE